MTPASDHNVLIVASDPLIAALVGSVVELSRLRAAFPRPDERPDEALLRVKPLIAILVDATENDAESDIFLARARKRGVHLMVFGSATTAQTRRAWAEARQVTVYTLPDDVSALSDELTRIASGAGKSNRTFERRGRPQIIGPLVFNDRSGKRWSVYDRRSADRRQHQIDREFVSESGEVRHCHINEVEAAKTSPEELTLQLERSRVEGKD